MSKRSNAGRRPDVPCGQTAMFTYQTDRTAKALALDGTRWVYPCGLCNANPVSEPGTLCSTCAPTPPRSRRKTAKTATKTSTKTTAKKAAKKSAKKAPAARRGAA